MITILNYSTLNLYYLPPDISQNVHDELGKILSLSGGQTIDNEYGRIYVLCPDDNNATVESVLGRPFDQLAFEGGSCRDGIFIMYLAGGGNECLDVLICADRDLIPAWRICARSFAVVGRSRVIFAAPSLHTEQMARRFE